MASNTPAFDTDSPAWKFYQRHVDFFVRKDIAGMLVSDYTDDAEVVSYDFAAKGKEQLLQLFTGYLAMMGDIKLKSTEHFRATADSMLLEATMETSGAGERKVWDVFVLRDGKIARHFTGIRQ